MSRNYYKIGNLGWEGIWGQVTLVFGFFSVRVSPLTLTKFNFKL